MHWQLGRARGRCDVFPVERRCPARSPAAIGLADRCYPYTTFGIRIVEDFWDFERSGIKTGCVIRSLSVQIAKSDDMINTQKALCERSTKSIVVGWIIEEPMHEKQGLSCTFRTWFAHRAGGNRRDRRNAAMIIDLQRPRAMRSALARLTESVRSVGSYFAHILGFFIACVAMTITLSVVQCPMAEFFTRGRALSSCYKSWALFSITASATSPAELWAKPNWRSPMRHNCLLLAACIGISSARGACVSRNSGASTSVF